MEAIRTLPVRAYAPTCDPLEEVVCPLCGGDSKKVVFHAHDVLFAHPSIYRIVACNECQMQFLSPRPTLDAIAHHYPDEYFIYDAYDELPKYQRMAAELASESRWRKVLRRIEGVCGQLPSDLRVLDVGSGLNNDFLVALRRARGIEGVAVDFKEKVAEYIREKLGMQAYGGTLKDAAFADGTFDLVTMHEYLEHEPNPREVLVEARRVVRRGGHIHIEVPYSDGPVAQFFGSRWSQVDAPRHLMHFSDETLSQMLRRTGFEPVLSETHSVPFMIGFSVLTALGRRRLGKARRLDLSLGVLMGLPFLPFLPWLGEYRSVVARAV